MGDIDRAIKNIPYYNIYRPQGLLGNGFVTH